MVYTDTRCATQLNLNTNLYNRVVVLFTGINRGRTLLRLIKRMQMWQARYNAAMRRRRLSDGIAVIPVYDPFYWGGGGSAASSGLERVPLFSAEGLVSDDVRTLD